MKHVVGVPHSGNRSVQAWLESRGEVAEIHHLQQHYLLAADIAALIATGNAVMAMRDPMLSVLSTASRRDDTPSAMVKSIGELFALEWPTQIIAVEFAPDLPVIGDDDPDIQPDAKAAMLAAYDARDAAALQAAFAATQPESIAGYDVLAAMQELAPLLRPRLEPLGYTDLWWWA